MSDIPFLSPAAAAILSQKGYCVVCATCPYLRTCEPKRELDRAEVEDREGIIDEFLDPTFSEP